MPNDSSDTAGPWLLTLVTIYCLWRRRNAVTTPRPVQAAHSRSSPGKVSDAASHRLSRSSHKPALWENKRVTCTIDDGRFAFFKHLPVILWTTSFPFYRSHFSELKALLLPSAQRALVVTDQAQLHMSHMSHCLRSRSYTTPCQHLHAQRVEIMGLIFNAGFMKDTLHI